MTIKTRNKIFLSCLIFIIIIAVVFIVSSILFIRVINQKASLELIFGTQNPRFNIIGNALLLFFALASSILFYRFFRKTSSAEIFFFYMFIFLTALESLKILTLGIEYLTLPFQWTVIASRLFYAMHIMGILCLFTSSLFACRLKYQYLESALGICFLVSLFLTPFMPLNTASFDANRLFSLALRQEFFTAFIIIELFAVFNYFYAAKLNTNANYYLTALGLALVYSGKEMLFLSGGLLITLIGFFSLSLGTIIFATRTHEIYLWF